MKDTPGIMSRRAARNRCVSVCRFALCFVRSITVFGPAGSRTGAAILALLAAGVCAAASATGDSKPPAPAASPRPIPRDFAGTPFVLAKETRSFVHPVARDTLAGVLYVADALA